MRNQALLSVFTAGVVVVSASSPAQATMIQWNISATVDSISDTAPGDLSPMALGDQLQIDMTFDTSQFNAGRGDGSLGAIFLATFFIESQSDTEAYFRNQENDVMGTTRVEDNFPVGEGTRDRFRADFSGIPSQSDSRGVSTVDLGIFVDAPNTLIDSDAFPSLFDFSVAIGQLSLFWDTGSAFATVDTWAMSEIPTPGAATTLALGAVMLGRRRRR